MLAGADVFVGVSAPNLLTGADIATMAPGAIVFALANPDPEVDPVAASDHAAVVATGRSDYPNQINNVLAFPGFFRGLLDAGASDITDAMMIAAATAIADCVGAGRAQPDLHRPQRLRPRGGTGRRRGGARGGGPAHRGDRLGCAGRATAAPVRRPDRRAGRRVSALADEVDRLLADADARLARDYPGEVAARQPVHTVYLPADRYAADTLERWRLEATAVLDRHAPTAEAFPEAFGIGAGLAAEVHDRVRAKLEREPVEDLRVDFEDGYGDRGDDEEDLAAVTAATALRHTVASGQAAPFGGHPVQEPRGADPAAGAAHAGAVRRRARRGRRGCRTGSWSRCPR